MIESPKNFIEQFQNFIEHIAGVMKTFLTKEKADNYYLGKSEKASSASSADTATKATQDANGNVIPETYATKSELTSDLAKIKALIPTIATFDEAKAGTDDTKMMTPLKVKEAIGDSNPNNNRWGKPNGTCIKADSGVTFPYTAPANGVFYARTDTPTGGGVLINNNRLGNLDQFSSISAPFKKGDVITLTGGTNNRFICLNKSDD